MPTEKEVYSVHAHQYERLILREDCDNNLPKAIDQIKDTRDIDIIEFGAGTGRLTRFLAQKAKSVAASDLSHHMLSIANSIMQERGTKNTALCVADMRHTPYANKIADMIIAGWSFCYLAVWGGDEWKAELKAGLDEAERLLRPGGVIILLENYGTGYETPSPPPHLNGYFEYLIENGFQDTWIRTDYAFNDLSEALDLSGFFFGEEMSARVEENNWSTLPECTGVLWKQF